ncbi:MAG: hypothetical protein QF664_00820 [Dehalococcoidia bacterium]|nr:hypothetical protein [Dehalococcoidia bacterium]
MNEIAVSASDSVSNIASIAQENAAGSEEVSAATEEMTAQVEQVSAAATELGRMADDLSEQVSEFPLSDDQADRLHVVVPFQEGREAAQLQLTNGPRTFRRERGGPEATAHD